MSLIFTLFCILINPNYANAQYFSGPIAASMGGAGRAAASGPETHFLNPAGLAHLKEFHASYIYRYEDLLGGRSALDHSVLVADAHEGVLIPVAFSYLTTERVSLGQRISEENFKLSIGGHVWDQIAFGMTGTRWSRRPPNVAEEVAWQLGFGFLFTPIENLGVGVTAQNILDADQSALLRPEAGFGLHYLFAELLRLRADVVYPTKFNPSKKGILMVGMESVLAYDIHMRFGARWDDVMNRADWTVGLGWDGPRLALNYAWEQDSRQNELFRQTFDLRMFF